MSVRRMLNLSNVTIQRVTNTPDGMGGNTESTSSTTIPRAAIWEVGSNNTRISDKIARSSTHVLVYESGEYTTTALDDTVTYGGVTYRVTGKPDDVKHLGRVTVVGLELVE